MGRHSTAEDDSAEADGEGAVGAALDPALADPALAGPALQRGRHSSPAGEDDAPVDVEAVEAPQLHPAEGLRKESGTRADLRLLRRNGAVRARCIAAVVVPFLIYSLVMVIIGRTDVYALWVWIPIVLAGVAVGTFLDLGHRAEGRAVAPAGVDDGSGHGDP